MFAQQAVQPKMSRRRQVPYFFAARRKASFASAVYATANPSVSDRLSICMSITLRYCVKTRNAEGRGLHRRVAQCL